MPSRSKVSVLTLLAPAMALALFAAGCASDLAQERALDVEREKSFKLIDQGSHLSREGSSLLALERYDRAALVHESPEAWYRLGQEFEKADKIEQAATAYNRALELASDYQEARLALLAIGYTPAGYKPTPEDLRLASELAAKRDADRQARLQAAQAQAAANPVDEAALAAKRQQAIADAAQRRIPTQTEVQSVIFAPSANRSQLPSATEPTFGLNDDVILGTYAYHLRKAQQLRAKEQYSQAEDEFTQAINADPTKIDARLELGDMLIREEKTEQALYQYNRAMQDFPSSPRPYHKLGNYYADINKLDQARSYYRQALEKDAAFYEAYNNLAVLDMRESKFDSARQVLDEVIKQDPTFANAYLNRGIIASDIDKDRQKALDCFNRYIELNGARSAEVRGWVRDLQAQPN